MISRTKIIQHLIHINEKLFFYPKLKKFYENKLSKNDTIIFDVGCNKGQSLEFFLKINKHCKFYAFEPNVSLFKKLQKNYMDNSKINFYNLGVSNINGELIFKQNLMDETSSFEDLNYNSIYLERKAKILGVSKENLVIDEYKVKVITLSSFLSDNNIKNIDVLKIDVEGHELKCLLGLFNNVILNTNIRYIQLEKHNDDMYLNENNTYEIKELLNNNLYKEVACINHGFGGIQEVIYEKL